MGQNNKWRIETRGGGQIADTGDYSDPVYVLTNGDIELVTKDDIDEDCDQVNMKMAEDALNELNANWEDWKLSEKEYELNLKQQEVDKWKEVANEMYMWLDGFMTTRASEDKSHPVHELIKMYEEALNNMP